ncbi:zinc finger CCCH domain-containing protein 18 isoform X1 [Neophocaena asiaeorientalis asiaeorientalis]|uniref:Zinc finger CCCH domain-containing protein 18 isoform X1 n=1 Tax=Neophocaena asiaeorientalis asiaeorientalis TaxID=1706337 RepID=A0A341AKU8_NEOAA|nr:zinc finger CCCH domain-containing protein 18 isoform X1 [Neophocaena asiaeorientalis asiaeorientalis]
MDVAESPDRDPRSPEDEEEEQQGLSDDDILRESGSEQDLDGAGGRASDAEDEENVAPGLSQEEEESRSDEEDRDSEAPELSGGPASPPRAEGDGGEEDRTSDLRDEASSVTRDLDEHELDYDEEVPEEPAPATHEDDTEKAGPEDDEERGEGAPGEDGKAGVHGVEDREPVEAAKEKRKEDDDGEIDDGEIDDDDLEEGEVKDPSDRKVRPRPTCRFFMKDVVTPLSTPPSPISNSIPFRGQVKGNCTWGMNCRFIHPGVNDKGNYSLITKAEPFPPNGAPPLGPHPLMPANPWGGPVVDEILPPPPPEPPTESAWERGLRHAKEVLKKATIRKEQEPDFEEKRFTVTIGEDEREFDKENEVFRDWNYRITRDVRDTALEPYADPYYDYEIERFWRGGQYENFRVQYTEAEPYHNYRERERERERENRQRERERERERDRERERRQRERERERERERDKERQRRKEEWERERAKRDEKDRQHRDRDKEREKEKEKPKARSPQPPSRQAEPPKKETASAGPQVKRADEWKDPWRRSKSPKKKLGVSVSPSRARRRRKTSASSASASNSSRSSSRSSSYSGSGSSRSRSRSSSYSSYSSRSSRHSSFSGSRSRSRSFSSSPSPSPTPSPHRPVRTKGEPAPPPAKAGEKLLKKPAPPPAPPQAPKTTAPAPEPTKPGDLREARRRERQARSPPRRRTVSGSGSGSSYSGSSSRSRSLSVSSVSSVSSATSSSSSAHSVDSDDMYADLASPVSSASSRSPTPAQTKKEKGKSKKEDGVRADKRKRDPSTQPPKPSRTPAGGRSSQQPTTPQQAPPGQPPPATFIAHKEIKLTLLSKAADKGGRKRYEPSDKDRQSPPPAKRANLSPDRGSRDRKSGGRLSSPKPERQRGQNSKAPAAPTDRKRPLSPQSKSSSKVTSVPGKASDAGAAAGASTGTKSGKASTLSRREELLKQLKAVEDAIARKRAKIPGKV